MQTWLKGMRRPLHHSAQTEGEAAPPSPLPCPPDGIHKSSPYSQSLHMLSPNCASCTASGTPDHKGRGQHVRIRKHSVRKHAASDPAAWPLRGPDTKLSQVWCESRSTHLVWKAQGHSINVHFWLAVFVIKRRRKVPCTGQLRGPGTVLRHAFFNLDFILPTLQAWEWVDRLNYLLTVPATAFTARSSHPKSAALPITSHCLVHSEGWANSGINGATRVGFWTSEPALYTSSTSNYGCDFRGAPKYQVPRLCLKFPN